MADVINEGITEEQRGFISNTADVKSGSVRLIERYNPNPAGVHQDSALTNISVMTGNDRRYATEALSTILVENESDVYPVYNSGDFRRSDVPARADGTPYRRVGWDLDFKRYELLEYGLETISTFRVQNNASGSVNPRRKAAERVSRTVTLLLDKQVGDFLTTAGNYNHSGTPSTLWDASGGDAFEDIRKQATAMELRIGFRPNRLVVNPEVHDAIVYSPAFQDRVKNTTTNYGGTDADQRRFIAEACGVASYVVYASSNNTANVGATESYSWCFGKHAALYYTEAGASLESPQFASILLHRNYNIQIETYNEPQIDAEVFRGKGMWDVHGFDGAKDAGYLFANPIS